MAEQTITLTASAYSTSLNTVTVTNPSNAYTDTTSSTYATVNISTDLGYQEAAYFYGFDFSQIPDDAYITSMTFKIKSSHNGLSEYVFLANRSTKDKLSNQTASPSSAGIITLTLTSLSYDDVIALGDNFSFGASVNLSLYTHKIYGIEIDVTYDYPAVNKVDYNNRTLIDLTGDDVTAADVLSGVLFHLPSGEQATGSLVPPSGGLEYETGTWSPSSNTTTAPTISFSNTHTDTPAFIAMWDNSSTARSTNYFLKWSLIDYDKLYPPLNQPSSGTWNGYFRVFSSTSSSTTEGAGGVGLTALPSNITSSSFVPYINGRNLRSTRVYKWIAIWGIPT